MLGYWRVWADPGGFWIFNRHSRFDEKTTDSKQTHINNSTALSVHSGPLVNVWQLIGIKNTLRITSKIKI